MPAITKPLAAMAAFALMAGAATSAAADYGVFVPYAAPSAPVASKDAEGAPLAIAPAGDLVTLVHFFASWCEPCEEELPKLVAFAAARPDRVRLIGVNVSEPASRARKFAARLGLTGPLAVDDDKAVANAFKVRGLPATVAFAPGGARALAASGPVDWTASKTAETLAALGR